MVSIEFTADMIAMFTAKDPHYDSIDETVTMILFEARAFHWIQIKFRTEFYDRKPIRQLGEM